RPVEPARAAARALEPLQRAHPQGRAHPRLSHLELDGARRVAVHRAGASRAAAHLLRARARGVPARRDALRVLRLRRALPRRGAVLGDRPVQDGRRHDVHRRRPQRGTDARGGRERDRGDARDRARRDARRRPRQRGRDGGPEARGVLLMATAPELMSTELLRLVTAGSVDDGKSTLIGRLLYDTKQILVDQLEHLEDASRRRGHDYVDLALLTDGLRAEREQGITIDVAYRSFVTPRRRFQLADAPGHVQYTRNMVTGASTADVAVILVDARQGVIEQTRRHAYILRILRVPHVVVAVNKMDLVDWSRERFDEIARDLERLGLPDLRVIPISA